MALTLKKYAGKGTVAATGLAKVMSNNIEDELTIVVGNVPDGAKAAYDPVKRVMYLPGIPVDDLDEDTLKQFRAFLAHEAFERGKSTWLQDPRYRENATKGLHLLINNINDARIDLEGAKEYPGAGMNIRYALQKDLDYLLETNRQEPRTPSVGLIATLFRFVGEGLMTYDDCVREFPQLRKWLQRVEPWMRNLDLSSEDKCIEQGLAIYRALKQAEKPQQSKEGQNKRDRESGEPQTDKATDEAPEPNDDTPQDVSGDEPQEGQGGDGEEWPEDRLHEESWPQGQVESLADVADTDHDIDQSILDRLADKMFEQRDDLGYSTNPYNREWVLTYTYDDRWDHVYTPNPDVRAVNPIHYRTEAHVLTTKLRQALTVPAPHMRRRQRKGYLDEREVWRVAAFGDEDVMKRQVRQEADSVACAVSWDESYSMDSGGRIEAVRLLAYAWNEALANLGIPTFLHGWTSKGGIYNKDVYRQEGIQHRIYKDFDDDPRSDKTLRRLYKIASGGGTPTGEGLAFAAERLGRRREKRRVLFFMTDGEPSMMTNGPSEVHYQYILRTLERCEQAGIEVVGIGIAADLDHFFPRWIRVNHARDLQRVAGDALLRVLREGKILAIRHR